MSMNRRKFLWTGLIALSMATVSAGIADSITKTIKVETEAQVLENLDEKLDGVFNSFMFELNTAEHRNEMRKKFVDVLDKATQTGYNVSVTKEMAVVQLQSGHKWVWFLEPRMTLDFSENN